MSENDPSSAVVELRGVRVEAGFPFDSALVTDGFVLRAGEMAVVEVHRSVHRSPLADVVSGLVTAAAGTAFFRGDDWSMMKPDVAGQARSHIGRVFDGLGSSWLSNLDIDENLTLSHRYHHGATDAAVRDEIESLAKVAGCWPLPEGRSTSVHKGILRRVEWVRAFAGKPALVILERPLRDVMTGTTEGISALVDSARERGAAILWMAREGDAWHDVARRPSSCWQLGDGRLAAVEMK